jgi:hypothetical protein
VSLGGDFNNLVGQPLDTLTITGAGSELMMSSALFTNSGNNVINVLDGGSIRQVERGDIDAVVAAFPGAFDAGSFGIALGAALGNRAELNVAGTGSTVSATRDIRIGYGDVFTGFDGNNDPSFSPSTATVNVTDGALLTTTRTVEVSDVDGEGTGFLTVSSGGTVVADTVRVNGGGVLSGNGGTIQADVILNGGIIAPGASPGILNIDGNLSVLSGLLSFEVAGTGIGMFDQLNISQSLFSTGSGPFAIEIRFMDLFVPQDGDVFSLLNVGGSAPDFGNPDEVTFSFFGLGAGQELAIDFSNGGFSARVLGDGNRVGATPIPLPASLPLLLGAFALLRVFRRGTAWAR